MASKKSKRRKQSRSLNITDIPQAKPKLRIAEDIPESSAPRGETIKPVRNGGYRNSWDSPMAGYCFTIYK